MTAADRAWLTSDEAIRQFVILANCSWTAARKMAEELATMLHVKQ